MSGILAGGSLDAAGAQVQSLGLWQRLAKGLDEYFARHARRTMPKVALRHCRQDIERCRRLLYKTATVPAARLHPQSGMRAR